MRLGVVVPAGGTSQRFGGADKLAADLGGRTLLDRTLDALPADVDVVCVGPVHPADRAVRWVQEAPAGGGPLAAVAAGCGALPPDVTVVALLGGDMPGAGRLLPSLVLAREAAGPAGCAVAVDAAGRRQPLLSVWSRAALDHRLAALGAAAGRPLQALFDQVDLVELSLPAGAAADVDTPADLEAARRDAPDPRATPG